MLLLLLRQVSLLVEQVDQYDQSSSSHACLKGIRAEPQQPELPRLRQALAAADRVVFMAEGADVRRAGRERGSCDRERGRPGGMPARAAVTDTVCAA